jgi:hypothetical protein
MVRNAASNFSPRARLRSTNSGSQGIAAKGRAMTAGVEHTHDVAARNESGNRHQTAAERLA